MRLRRLALRNVRGVEARSLTFADDGTTTGVVIVEGCNEAGKSTLADALDALLACKDSSKNADVRSLKTAGRDEAPEVEAELEVGDHRFVYRKQFLKRTATELRIIAPKGETLSGEEAHARVDRILAEHLDLGLWSSLRLRQGDGLEQAGPGGTRGLATALAGRTEASAIGDRELAVLDAVQQEYERYHTAKTGAPKPLLKTAEAAVTELTERLEDLDGRRAALAEDVAGADRLDRSLPELRAAVKDAAARAEELAVRRAEVEALTGQLQDCERAEEAAAGTLAHLQERRDHRTALVAELVEVDAERSALAAALDSAEGAQRTTADHLAAARAELEAAQGRQREARLARQRAQHALDHLHYGAALAMLRARAARASAALTRLREAEAQAAAITVDEPLLDVLRAAQTDVARAEAALDAASPELRFTAARAVPLEVGGETEALEAGRTRQWTVHGTLTLRLDDVGEVEVSAGAGTDGAADAHRAATDRLGDGLERGGVADLAAAESAFRRRQDAERSAEEARRERDTALEGETAEALADEIDRLERQIAAHLGDREDDAPLPDDAEAARTALDAAVDAERAADEAVAEPESAVERARAELDRRREAVVEQRTRTDEVARRATAIDSELAEARRAVADDELAAQVDRAEETWTKTRAELEAARTALAGAEPDTVTTLADNAAAVADDARTRLADAEQSLREAQVRIAALGGDGLWEQREAVAAALAHASEELDGLRRRATAARTLLEALEHHRSLARERYAAPLHNQLLTYGRMLHGPEFDIELDEDLRVSRRQLDGVWLDVEQLSVGAREQLALLGRLACATLLGEQGGLLLFDDALGNTDPERLELIGAVLRLAGAHCQVIVLTCYPERYRHVGGATRIAL